MTWAIEFFQFFDSDFPYLAGHRLYHHSQDEVSQIIYIVIRECWGSALFSFVMIPILFIALNIFSLIWWLEFKDPPKYIPKCVCQLAQKTGALSK